MQLFYIHFFVLMRMDALLVNSLLKNIPVVISMAQYTYVVAKKSVQTFLTSSYTLAI